MLVQVFLRALFILSIMSLYTGLSANHAYAKYGDVDVFEWFKKPMPELPLANQEAFEKATKPVEEVPHNDEALAYSMRIKNTWQKDGGVGAQNTLFGKKLFLNVSSFVGKPTVYGRSRIDIEAKNLDEDLTAKQWYIGYVVEQGNTIEGFIDHSDNRIESLMIVTRHDYSYYLRSLVLVNGSKIIMVKYYVPIENFLQQAVMQEMVLSSFSLTNIKERERGEMLSHKLRDIAQVKYPSGWKVFANSRDGKEVTIANIREVVKEVGWTGQKLVESSMEGKVYVMVTPRVEGEDHNEILEEYKRKVESEGIFFGSEIPDETKFQYTKQVSSATTKIHKGTYSKNTQADYELWVSVMTAGKYNYFMLLLTPTRNEEFMNWAVNTQSYKVMLKELVLLNNAFFGD